MGLTYKEYDFGRTIVDWWLVNGREYPWRNERTPYRVLVSEYMLIRTKAKNVIKPYMEFIEKLPSVESLPSDKCLWDACSKAFNSLGLPKRREALFETLKTLRNRSGVPKESSELEELPLVGQYIRAAVRVFGFGIPDSIIDSNVLRLLGRYAGLNITDSLRRTRHFAETVNEFRYDGKIVEYSYGLLDYASSICTKNPGCAECLFKSHCCHVKLLSRSDQYE